jgi:Zn-dependent M28 family amino/carboxypeptidase
VRVKSVLIAGGVVLLIAALAVWVLRRGRSHRSALPPASHAQQTLAAELEGDVRALCARGPRTIFIPENIQAAATHIEAQLSAAGYRVERHVYDTDAVNLIAEVKGSNEIVVIGAHYDSVDNAPGADDNASGTAALLALARRFAKAHPTRTLRFVFFTNEEPPHFMTEEMGSWQYAKRCRERNENIVAMVNLEMLGYYNDARGSQTYPVGLAAIYPDTADFIAFASNVGSGGLTRRCVAAFRKSVSFPAESAVLPGVVPEISFSDHWSFWQFDYEAIIVTDTAMFRNPHYHRLSDTPETLDYERMARVVEGLAGVVGDLSR